MNIVSRELLNSVRTSDTVGRFGGDEFLVLMNNISKGEDILKIADNIMNIFKHPFTIKGQEYYLTVSAGVAVYPVDGDDVDTLIKNADVAMYNAKEKGKNQYVLCTPDMKNEVQRIMELTNSLYRAREKNELVLHYQPQVNVKTGRIVGLEALLRWNHPEMGMISPNIFIPLAEKTGLINPIGEWALREACHQNKKWLDMGLSPIRIAVNISYVQLKNPKLITQVEHTLKEFCLNPQFLEFEITETVASKESNYIIDTLERLKSLGLSISIDDFGTEYSSLSRLRLLPIDCIKMDMQFVHGIDGTEKDRAYAKLIINLAKNLGLKLIAEGVETSTQMEFLNQRRCDEIQGYYYYKPMPAEEIEVLLRNNRA